MGETPGFDRETGFGFIQADAALSSIASPLPNLIRLVYDETITPGDEAFTLTVEGKYFKEGSTIWFRDQELPTTFVSSSQLTAEIPEFDGNPPLRVYSDPITDTEKDGG